MSRYKSNRIFRASLIVFLSFTLFTHSSCGRHNFTSNLKYEFDTTLKTPDYCNLNYWAAHPFKADPSDNIPTDLNDDTTDSLADVFFYLFHNLQRCQKCMTEGMPISTILT